MRFGSGRHRLQIGGALALGSLALVASFVTSSQRTDSGRVETPHVRPAGHVTLN